MGGSRLGGGGGFFWEEALLEKLNAILFSVALIKEREDEWVWTLDSSGHYTTKSVYSFLEINAIPIITHQVDAPLAFKVLWKGKVPSKVLAFSWQILLDRIPTKVNLFSRQVLLSQQSLLCVFCGSDVETIDHLFMSVSLAYLVWTKVYG